MVLTPENVFLGGGLVCKRELCVLITILSDYAMAVCIMYYQVLHNFSALSHCLLCDVVGQHYCMDISRYTNVRDSHRKEISFSPPPAPSQL